MDFKILSVVLIVGIILIGAAFVYVVFGETLAERFGGSSSASDELDNTFGTPPEGFEPPQSPTS